MDEPFGALDAQTRSAMQDLLLRGARDRRQDGDADHAFGRGSDLPRVAIIVMSARPTRIREVIDVPFAYPRSESLHETPRIQRAALPHPRLVMQEYAAQDARRRGTRSDRPRNRP